MLAVKSAAAGVLIEAHPDRQGCWFVTWLAQQPAATNINLMALEHANSVAQALAVAPTLGIPHQNFVVGDQDGHIAWTIAGRIPVDRGATRANGASAWTSPESHPHILDPAVGRIWTANARATDDPDQLSVIGGDDAAVGSDYDLGARARQIRDDLLALHGPAAPADMLRIQLDDRAVFLARWRTMITDLLDADAVANQPRRAQLKRLVTDWDAHAGTDSVGYRLVRAYHERLQLSVWNMLLAALRVAPEEQIEVPSQFEPALWRLVNERPLHMLAADYGDWRQFLLAQVDSTLTELLETCPELVHCTWGSRKPVRVRHPLSPSLPFLSRLLDMPDVELPGDHDMPRVQDGTIGASERFAVSPGHEEQGYLHMPGGQSGHPLSPYYRAGFTDWANGTPVPFLPRASQHRLTLQPD
jgi:penicillin amidase